MIRTSYRSTAEEDEEEDSLPNSQTMVDTFGICQSFNFETIGAVDACLVPKVSSGSSISFAQLPSA